MDQTYLIFGIRGTRCGLDARAVREIVWLPELSPVEELPSYIVGVFNLRGRIVPVMDLGLRLGHPQAPFLPGDHVIVIEANEALVGVVADELYDVLSIAQSAIEDARSYQGAGGRAQFVHGQARLDDGLAMLLDVEALLRSTPTEAAPTSGVPAGAAVEPSSLFGNLSAEDAKTMHSRARALSNAQELRQQHGLEGFAVIRLEGELFGVELGVVREFCHLRGIAPLPCSPSWVLGSMNLRGDILTLVDLRPALDLAMQQPMREVVVVNVGEIPLGLPTAEIVDVVHLAPSDIAAIPVASDRVGKASCKGAATVAGRVIGIIDLAKILAALQLESEELQRAL